MKLSFLQTEPVNQASFAYRSDETPKTDSLGKKYRRRKVARFLNKECGTISVEGVLWLPIFLIFFSLIIDVSNMLQSRSIAMRIVEDANRHAITGYLVDQDEVTAQIEAQILSVSDSATVDVTWSVDVDSNDIDIVSVVRYPASDVQLIGLFAAFIDLELAVHSYNRFEI